MTRANRSLTGEKPNLFALYLDEFQQYITDDVAAMMDEVLKGGLSLCLAHQHLGHLADNPKLLKSIFTNARNRAVFGGLDYEDACVLGNEMFLPDLNSRQIKKAYYHTIHLYEEDTRTVRSKTSGWGSSESSSHSSGHGSGHGSGSHIGAGTTFPTELPGVEGWFSDPQGFASHSEGSSESRYESDSSSEGYSTGESEFESEGETEVPVWVPIPVKELTSETEWGREEKLSKVAELLKFQPQRLCWLKLENEKTQPMKVPFVRPPSLSTEFLLEYEKKVFREQGALPAAEVDRRIAENQERFLLKAAQPEAAVEEESFLE